MWNINFRLQLKNIVRNIFASDFIQSNMSKSAVMKKSKIKSKQRPCNCSTDIGKLKFQVLSSPIKSASDKKDYRVIRLQNGLTACLISDLAYANKQAQISDSESESESGSEFSESDTELNTSVSEAESVDAVDMKMKKVPFVEQKMAAAALTVEVGSFSDPKDIPGLAHFLEHMVFMGSEKFPQENDFDSFIKKKGGSDNASTDCECTTFYFECLEKHLLRSLDKFAQFFIAPLMKEESMTREREAIQSEFQMALPSDSSRKEQLMLSFFNSVVPINTFTWGNLKTLRDNVEDKALYKQLHEFRKRHYSAHRMTLAIQARLPLDELQTYVINCFSKVPNNNLPSDDFKKYSEVIFDVPAFTRIYYVEPMKDIIELNLTWPLPSLLHMYRSKPHEYVSWLLGDEGKGSLFSYLKQKVWALAIYTGNDESGSEHNSIYSLFRINIALTKEGLYHLSEVIDAVYSYIHLLKKVGPQERIYNEIKLIEETSFRFMDEDSPVEYVEDLAEDMQLYPPEHYLCGGQLYFDYDPQALEMVMAHLVPEKMNIMVLSSTLPYNVTYNKIEPWFNIPYTDTGIPKDWIKNWLDILPYPEFSLPEENRFLTNNFMLLPDIDNPKYPEKILQSPLIELWYRKDQTFKLPIAYYYYCFISPLCSESALNACMTDVFVNLLGLQVAEDAYPAIKAELSFSLGVEDRGILIRFNGYNEKLPVLVELVLKYFKNVSKNMNSDLFEAVKDTQKRMYYNKFLKPSTLAKDIRFSVLLNNHWTALERYSAMSELTLEKMKAFSEQLVKNFYIQGLIQGNVDKETAIQTSKVVVESLQCEPLPPHTYPKKRVLQLPQGERCCKFNSFNKNDSNSIIANYYQSGPFSLKTSVVIEILMMYIEEPLFDVLRTKEQLGYHVFCTVRDTFGILGYSISVNAQAQKNTTEYVDARVELFIKHVSKLLKKMSTKKINEIKRDLIKLKHCADDNLKEEVDRNWNEIISRDYLFDRLQQEIRAVEEVKLVEIRKFWEDHNMCGNQGSLKKLSIQVVGYDIDKEQIGESNYSDVNNEDLNLEETAREHFSLEFIKPEASAGNRSKEYFITDIKEFRDKQVSYPIKK